MTPPTALDTGRALETQESGGDENRPQGNRSSHGHRHSNSRGMTIAMILGAIAFMVCIALIALGGTGGDADRALPAATATSDQSAPVPADAPITDAAVQEAPPETVDVAQGPNGTLVPEPQEANPAADLATEETSGDAATEPADPTPAQPETPVLPDPDSPPVPPGAPEQYSVLSGGKIYLRGTLPEAEISRQIVAAVEQVIGVGNVIGEYVIDPEEPFDPNDPTPVFINDTITFASGSAEIAPDFYPLIATAPVLLAIQPTVVVTITGHTDDQGTDESNLALSQERVDGVRDWIISQGGDGERLIAIGKGETEPVADNDTEEGRLANRRVEFLIEGFDFTLGS